MSEFFLIPFVAVVSLFVVVGVLSRVLTGRRFEKLRKQYPDVYAKLLREFQTGSYFRRNSPEEDARTFLAEAVAIVERGKDFKAEIKGGGWQWEERIQGYTDGGSHDFGAGQPYRVEVSDGEPLSIRLIEIGKIV